MVKQRTREITDKYIKLGHIQANAEITSAIMRECILKEVSATLAHRKRLHSHISKLEMENNQIENTNEDRKMPPPVPVATVKPNAVNNKMGRKTRESRSRSQEWPDVPDIGKIEEQNPEILAQKILETGRQIEAGKLGAMNAKHNNHYLMNGHIRESEKMAEFSKIIKNGAQSSLKNQVRSITPTAHIKQQPLSPVKCQKSLNVVGKVQESPKVINFEDRLKSIITSVLNEDQEQRKAAHQSAPNASAAASAYPNLTFPQQQQQQLQSQSTTSRIYPYTTTQPSYSQTHFPGQYAHSPQMQVPLGDVKPVISNRDYKHSLTERFLPTDAMRNAEAYSRHGMLMQPADSYRSETPRQGERLEVYRTNGEVVCHPREVCVSPAARNVLQPDYTQVSPAKLALRRHLSQEKLTQHHPSSSGSRTIGDLVNGEIERTLEISNQSIINAAVNMSSMLVTPSNMMNSNIPPRPERVNVRVDTNLEPLRQVYSPISRPNSAEGLESFSSNTHRSKSPVTQPVIANSHLSQSSFPTNSPRTQTPQAVVPPTAPPRTTVLYQPPKGAYASHQYVPLPRAEIKPYHESYFSETKPSAAPGTAPPLEGLAACLQARVLASDYWKVKEEARPQYPTDPPPPLPLMASQPTSVIKTEICDKSPVACQYAGASLKRASPVIHGPSRPLKKQHLDSSLSALAVSMPSPEPHSNTSTPLEDELPEPERALRPDEGTS